jgi:hypothetical protein
MEEKSKFDQEINMMKDTSSNNILELKNFSLFFKIFSTSFKEHITSITDKITLYNQKTNSIENQSLLSTNLNSIVDNFNAFNNNSKNLLTKIQNELINTLEVFTSNQVNIYQENNDELNNLYLNYNNNKKILLNSKYNYYKSFYNAKKEEIEQNTKLKEQRNIIEEEKDILIKDKMEAKNNEMIYKYAIEKYNSSLKDIEEEYTKIKNKMEIAEQSRITFIKASFDKYQKFWNNYSKIINEYTEAIKILFSDDICNKIQTQNIKEISKFTANTKQSFISSRQQFISYNDFCQKFDSKQKDKNNLVPINFNFYKNVKIINIDNKIEKNKFYNELINKLVGEEEVQKEKISSLIEILHYQKDNEDNEKEFLDVIIEKNKSSLRFQNLKNLELLSIPISYITLKQNSIFEGKFELNFKIIFIAERVFYQNKINNNKVYLSAILSKNKFYRTKLFWRNVIELKLVNKLEDHISRMKNEVFKGLFSKLGDKMGLTNSTNSISHKNSFLAQTRIFPLIKNYNNLEQNKIPILDKMATKEMYTILKTSIPNFSNFNFPSIPSLDLISKLSQEYKMSNDEINYFVIYYKVSNHTIRQLLPHGKNFDENENNNERNTNIKIRNIKILSSIIPFLDYKDYNNLLFLSKYYNKKIKKKIYKYVLKQKNVTMKTRLHIWYNMLKINELKKKYNYKDVLSKANDAKNKHEIFLDIRRTNVDEDQKDLHKERIINVLYAVSQCNFGIKYVQGMNFIVSFLYEVYGEEEAFYIFLSFFHSTQYSIIFDKDLIKLNEFFYVFNRIISLLEPELSSFFNINGVNVNFFATPWFITLFTGSHQNLRNEKDNKNILIRIFDNFITSGWKAMMVVGCSLLHSFESKLMSLKYEDMLEFLINGMLRSEFFMKENEDNLEDYFMNIKISRKLTRTIESEYAQEKMMNEIKSKKK